MPLTMNLLNDMGLPIFSALPTIMTFAEAPDGSAVSPRHALRASDHHSGMRSSW